MIFPDSNLNTTWLLTNLYQLVCVNTSQTAHYYLANVGHSSIYLDMMEGCSFPKTLINHG